MTTDMTNLNFNNPRPSWKIWLISLLLVSIVSNVYLFLHHKTGETTTVSGQKELYTCPMHPQVIQDHPGDCPICGMKLVKKATVEDDAQKDTLDGVTLSPSRELLANVKTEKPVMQSFAASSRVPAKIVFQEDSQWKLTLRTMARIDSVYVAESGTAVIAGDKLVTVYSPDLIAAEQEYLLAVSDPAKSAILTATEAKLHALGLESNQIEQIRSTGKPQDRITFHAQKRGVLMERMAKSGEWAMSGMTLLDFVDPSNVWVEAAFYERDANTVKLGDKLTVQAGAETATATVKSIGAELDMMTHTLPVRAELGNSDGRWKPGTTVEVVWSNTASHEYLSVPEEAVLQTGAATRVWVKNTENRFLPVVVTIGAKLNGRVAILSGLKENDDVAVTGAYLIDAESQMKNTGGSMPGMNMKDTTKHVQAATTSQDKTEYTCPMHQEIISDKPGKCPICSMNLVEKES